MADDIDRIHAYCDLKAYVCTYGDQSCDARLFGDHELWFEHEMSPASSFIQMYSVRSHHGIQISPPVTRP